MLTEIIRKDPPPQRRPAVPSTEVDAQILAVLAGGDRMELRDITKAVGRTTHHTHARVMTLVRKGLVARERPPGAPSRGPGASLYQLVST
jgi:DNA-binding MarR family transcriptional regulator